MLVSIYGNSDDLIEIESTDGVTFNEEYDAYGGGAIAFTHDGEDFVIECVFTYNGHWAFLPTIEDQRNSKQTFIPPISFAMGERAPGDFDDAYARNEDRTYVHPVWNRAPTYSQILTLGLPEGTTVRKLEGKHG